MRKIYHLLLLLILLPKLAYGANAYTEPGEYFLEQQRLKRNQQLMEKPPAEVEAPQTQQPVETTRKGACFFIESVQLEGVSKLSAKEIDNLTQPSVGRCVDINDINKLVTEITNFYIEKGYVTTRTYIPPQNLKSGILQLKVIEGIIEKIILNDGKSWQEKNKLRTAFPGLQGEILNLRDLEQGVDQINRLASENATLKLWPGDEAGGTLVRVEDKPNDRLRGVIAYDNYGQESTGINRLRLGVEADNMLGLNDTGSLYYIGSQNTNSLAMSSSIPYGYWTTSFDASYSEYLSIIDEASELFGQSYNTNLTVNRIIWRDKNTKTAVEFMLNVKESTRLINDVLLAPQPLTVIRFGMLETIRTKYNVLNFDAHYSRGLAMLGAIEDPSGISDDTPHAQFDKIDGGITLFQPIGKTTLRSSVRGQYSMESLYSSEQLTLGDNSTVRGFSQHNVTGDSGLYTQNELSLPMPEKIATALPFNLGKGLQPYVFTDAGYTTLKTTDQYDQIVGTGAGIRFNNGKRLSSDLTFALPLYTNGAATSDGAEIYFTLSYKLF